MPSCDWQIWELHPNREHGGAAGVVRARVDAVGEQSAVDV